MDLIRVATSINVRKTNVDIFNGLIKNQIHKVLLVAVVYLQCAALCRRRGQIVDDLSWLETQRWKEIEEVMEVEENQGTKKARVTTVVTTCYDMMIRYDMI